MATLEIIKPIKIITLGDDPWSMEFKSKIMNSHIYKTMWQFEHCPDIPMRETYYHKWFAKEVKNRGTAWGGLVKNEVDIKKQYDRFLSMYKSYPDWDESDEIKKSVSADKKTVYYYGNYPVSINKNGDIKLFDGNHRLAMLLYNKVPIKLAVVECDKAWLELHSGLKKIYPTNNPYQPLVHPFFSDWECKREETKEDILKSIVIDNGLKNILDLGICHGYTLYKLRSLLDAGTGVEYHETRYKFSNLLFGKLGYRCIQKDIFKYLQADNDVHDAVFALAILHHLMNVLDKKDFTKMLRIIKRKCRIFVYSLPESLEPQYKWMYSDITDYNKFIMEIMGFKRIKTYKLRRREMVVLY